MTSDYLGSLDDRIAHINRQINVISSQQAILTTANPDSEPKAMAEGDRKVQERECNLRIYALSEEKEMISAFRSQVIQRELRILDDYDTGDYIAFLEGSRGRAGLDKIIDQTHVLALEKMHYRTTFHLEAKDWVASYLPHSLSRYLSHPVYQRIQELAIQLDISWTRFLAESYPMSPSMG